MPRIKDDEHNKKVDEISQLISPVTQLYKKGIFYPENVTVASTVTGTFLYTFNTMNNVNLNLGILGLLAISTGTMIGLNRFQKTPFEQAKYLDVKLNNSTIK